MLDMQPICAFQRVLLTTDATLTYLLEAFVGEPLRSLKLHEKTYLLDQALPALQVPAGEPVIRREVLLQGIQSHKHFLYAQSLIIPARLDTEFLKQLTLSQQPIGKLWNMLRIEVLKQNLALFREPAPELSVYFDCSVTTPFLGRTYIVYHKQQAVMQITEKFPETYFTDQ